MRVIECQKITNAVKEMCISSNYNVDESLLKKLQKASIEEESKLGKSIINEIIENDIYAKKNMQPMCQDTGIVVVFLEIGYDVKFDGDIYDAINKGISEGYNLGYLRKSVVRHPIDRVNTNDNTPAIIHTKLVAGDKLKIKISPKGAGSENMSKIAMLKPADGINGVKDFVLDTIFNAKGNPCPPIIVGIGIGGNFEKSALLAKEALLRDLDDESSDPISNKLENELLDEINRLGIGPMGLGGTQTALAVKVNTYPCHIASLPVAVNIQCHAHRHMEVEL